MIVQVSAGFGYVHPTQASSQGKGYCDDQGKGYLRVTANEQDGSYDVDNWVEDGDEVEIIRYEGNFAWIRTERGHQGFLRKSYLVSDYSGFSF